jgi:hypothetical protein
MASASINKHIDDFRRRLEGQEHLVESCCDGGKQKCETEGVDLPHTYPYEIVTTQKPEQIEDIIYRSVHTGKMELKTDPQAKQVGGEHYKGLAIEPVEYCQRNKLGYCESNCIKYVTRHRLKGGVEDLRKAIHYLELLLKLEYAE